MIALDTNILTRFYTDDPADREARKQRRTAESFMARQQALFLPKTVALELVWVLRAVYDFSREQVISALDHLLGLAQVRVEDREAVEAALFAYRQGIDFADALHLASSANCAEFVTFDDGFAKRAARLALQPTVRAP